MAGLNECEGDYVILMDDDLQHPPSKINDIYLELKKNFDVCYVNYIRRKHKKWKIFLSKAKFIETDEQFILPDLLSEPIIEQLVKRRTAETYEVKADGEIITCEPAESLPLAQRYFMY